MSQRLSAHCYHAPKSGKHFTQIISRKPSTIPMRHGRAHPRYPHWSQRASGTRLGSQAGGLAASNPPTSHPREAPEKGALQPEQRWGRGQHCDLRSHAPSRCVSPGAGPVLGRPLLVTAATQLLALPRMGSTSDFTCGGRPWGTPG